MSWRKITCAERDALKAARDLVPATSRTDIDGYYGDPEIFTEWADRATEQPVLQDRRFPAPMPIPPLSGPRMPDLKPCEHYQFEENDD